MQELMFDLVPLSPLQTQLLNSGISSAAAQVEQSFKLAFELGVLPVMRRQDVSLLLFPDGCGSFLGSGN
jgi:hypothetical protein